jgi:small-conductance mechanosensitive channel
MPLSIPTHSFVIVAIGFGLAFLLDRVVVPLLVSTFKKKELPALEALFKATAWYLFLLIFLLFVEDAWKSVTWEEHWHGRVKTALDIIIDIVAILMITKMLVKVIKELTQKDDSGQSTSIFSIIIRFSLYLTGFLIITWKLGFDITPALAALGVGGLAVALALQETLSNFFSGLNLLASRRMLPGDYVRLDNNMEGFIEDIGWRSTVIRELSNTRVIVPNTKMASMILRNYSIDEHEQALVIPLSVAYDADLAKVEAVCVKVAKHIMVNTAGAMKDFEPFIRFNKFADSGIEFNVILRIAEVTDQFLVRHEFIKALLIEFRAEGLEIPYPTRTIYHISKEGENAVDA